MFTNMFVLEDVRKIFNSLSLFQIDSISYFLDTLITLLESLKHFLSERNIIYEGHKTARLIDQKTYIEKETQIDIYSTQH